MVFRWFFFIIYIYVKNEVGIVSLFLFIRFLMSLKNNINIHKMSLNRLTELLNAIFRLNKHSTKLTIIKYSIQTSKSMLNPSTYIVLL